MDTVESVWFYVRGFVSTERSFSCSYVRQTWLEIWNLKSKEKLTVIEY